MMLFYVVIGALLTFVWVAITAQFNGGGVLIGAIISLAVLAALRPSPRPLQISRLPMQIAGAIVYLLVLFRDIVRSSVDVARRALSPQMGLNPGVIAVATQDADASEIVAALSAHNITITPGELVVDFDDNHTMYVHCLDVRTSAENADAAQHKRLRMLNRMLRGEW
jgi:multicomponent Na+:H+ antiporter subunit E